MTSPLRMPGPSPTSDITSFTFSSSGAQVVSYPVAPDLSTTTTILVSLENNKLSIIPSLYPSSTNRSQNKSIGMDEGDIPQEVPASEDFQGEPENIIRGHKAAMANPSTGSNPPLTRIRPGC